jgi:hypothetical protein
MFGQIGALEVGLVKARGAAGAGAVKVRRARQEVGGGLGVVGGLSGRDFAVVNDDGVGVRLEVGPVLQVGLEFLFLADEFVDDGDGLPVGEVSAVGHEGGRGLRKIIHSVKRLFLFLVKLQNFVVRLNVI